MWLPLRRHEERVKPPPAAELEARGLGSGSGDLSTPFQVMRALALLLRLGAGTAPPPPTPSTQVRCVDNTCVAAPTGVPGMDNATCAKACGPVSACLSALLHSCGAVRAKGGDPSCSDCVGAHQGELHAAGCAPSDIAGFCGGHNPPSPPPPVANCSSLTGNCFTISGARNSDPTLPSGADLNGEYALSNHTCPWGKGKGQVWQKGGSGGPVLYYDGTGKWDVGPSAVLDDYCGSNHYLDSGLGSCLASPDGVGCVGMWEEYDRTMGWRKNSAFRVVLYNKTVV